MKYYEEESGGFDAAANRFAAQNCQATCGNGEAQERGQRQKGQGRARNKRKRAILAKKTKKLGRRRRA
jgi:hypothetical protein